MLIREKYLAKIRSFYHTESLIKIIYGMRRSGKSVILNQIKDELLNQGIKEDNIIYINPGSVTYPRGTYRNPTFCLFDTKTKDLSFFDIKENKICDPFIKKEKESFFHFFKRK